MQRIRGITLYALYCRDYEKSRNCRNSDFEKTAVTRLGKSQQVALI